MTSAALDRWPTLGAGESFEGDAGAVVGRGAVVIIVVLLIATLRGPPP